MVECTSTSSVHVASRSTCTYVVCINKKRVLHCVSHGTCSLHYEYQLKGLYRRFDKGTPKQTHTNPHKLVVLATAICTECTVILMI